MRRAKTLTLLLCALLLVAGIFTFQVIRRGFSAKDKPSLPERIVARFVRNLSIPRRAARQQNPLKSTPSALQDARASFMNRCATCHGIDGKGDTDFGHNLYPKPPNLTLSQTQNLTDGQIHYIIENGVRLTGMPAWDTAHNEAGDDAWKLVLLIRDLPHPSIGTAPLQQTASGSAHYTGSPSCQKCHAEIYAHWKTTPMANVVRDPREHPDAIIPDLATNPFKKFAKEDVAFVYGSLWKQRYFTKVGDDYFPQPAQWDVLAKTWRPYFVANGTDWWATLYPPDNFQRPTGPLCDGCHSVEYNIHTKQVAEWNVGCERCHGPGSDHVAHPTASNILNPGRMDSVRANDTCIECHSQGRPLTSPIDGKYYDWPVGYHVGQNLHDFWQLEDHKLGDLTFSHFPDGTAHKNRMQGNDFVQSLMYRRGITCFSCHDVHGTQNYAQLRKPVDKLCLDCHSPMAPEGPRAATLELHTHHKAGSTGSQCVACHMPKMETTIADSKVRAHTFNFIYPAMTDKYKIPNPCTTCHADKSTAWATEAMRRWPEYSAWRMQ
jgi:predicted CXXCH cytochrome family protein